MNVLYIKGCGGERSQAEHILSVRVHVPDCQNTAAVTLYGTGGIFRAAEKSTGCKNCQNQKDTDTHEGFFPQHFYAPPNESVE